MSFTLFGPHGLADDLLECSHDMARVAVHKRVEPLHNIISNRIPHEISIVLSCKNFFRDAIQQLGMSAGLFVEGVLQRLTPIIQTNGEAAENGHGDGGCARP
ncbi:hypothetical protein LTS18_003746 [Coniosporium uncinatum]|uniref:Uncharacterized protein n=1 Tax=Coniosporium uncinatum TaxID=93489 RepID=A0ACC3DBL8_9PEZI|nr:hypothetical protein LTS18_003746 [Coniosporium uncinatum]